MSKNYFSVEEVFRLVLELYAKLCKTFSEFYRRYYNLISKFQIGLKSLLRRGLSEPELYYDLMYNLKKIVGSNNFERSLLK